MMHIIINNGKRLKTIKNKIIVLLLMIENEFIINLLIILLDNLNLQISIKIHDISYCS